MERQRGSERKDVHKISLQSIDGAQKEIKLEARNSLRPRIVKSHIKIERLKPIEDPNLGAQ